jgi:hypothetical protein
MAHARDLVVAPVARRHADDCVRRWHYSGRTYSKSRLHLGVFLDGVLLGAMQWGPSLDERRTLALVPGTPRDGFLELNRMALAPDLPRNAESRALGVALRMIRRHAPHIEWVVSYADATQCGDGAIYRAAGFALTGVRPNTTLWRAPDGAIVSDVGVRTTPRLQARYGTDGTRASMRAAGLAPLRGYMLRYMMFLDPTARARLAVPVLPYAAIAQRGAAMYRGRSLCVGGAGSGTPGLQPGGDGATPIPTLHDPG